MLGLAAGPASGQYVTLAGSLSSSNGMPAANYSISFTPSQFGFVAGTSVIINTSTSCATSVDGSVVGLPNPLAAPVAAAGFGGMLPAGSYYVEVALYDAAGNTTLVSPERVVQLSSPGSLTVSAPAGMPAGAAGMRVYLGTSSGGETLQGSPAGGGAWLQVGALAPGAPAPSSNTTLCKQVANDAIWPSGTGYTVALTDTDGNTLPGYPMQWQLMGPGSTVNLSSGLPYYHGTVFFPVPILASPLNHALQSIAGPLSLTNYSLTSVSALGVGTALPAWPIDVENGPINSNVGFLVNGLGIENHVLCGNGSAFVDCSTIPAALLSGLYYQAVTAAGAYRQPQTTLSFLAPLTVANNAGGASTDVGLAPSGIAGTYTSPLSITFDTFGRETAITAGSAVARTCNTNGCYYSLADGTIVQWGTVGGCADHDGSNGCAVAVTFPTPFTTTANQAVVASCGAGIPNCNTAFNSLTTTGFSLQFAALVFVGGNGVHLTGSQTGNWVAVGH